jgi:hypothetical protein
MRVAEDGLEAAQGKEGGLAHQPVAQSGRQRVLQVRDARHVAGRRDYICRHTAGLRTHPALYEARTTVFLDRTLEISTE